MTSTNINDIEFSWAKAVQGRIRWITPPEKATLMTLLPENVAHLVKVAIETGCRRDELLTVVPEQINGDRLHLWKTKTDSPRTVYMEPSTTALLTGPVVSGRLPTRNYLRRQWAKAKDAMELTDDGNFVFHCCRHTRATRLLEAGIDIRVVKEMLGHKRIETTMRYAHVKASNIEAAMEKVGGYERDMAAEALISATPTPPHQSPSEGVNVDLEEWRLFQEWRKSA